MFDAFLQIFLLSYVTLLYNENAIIDDAYFQFMFLFYWCLCILADTYLMLCSD